MMKRLLFSRPAHWIANLGCAIRTRQIDAIWPINGDGGSRDIDGGTQI